MPNIKCPVCGKKFYCRPSRIKKQAFVCCSKECSSQYRRNLYPEAERTCKNCGKKFRVNPAYISRGDRCDFCSRKCFFEFQRKHPEEFFGEAKYGYWDGHKITKDYKGHLVCSGGRVHRLIMEKHLGRKLSKKEIVHHIDGNRQNNSLGNLEVLTRSEHSKLHSRRRWKGHRVNSRCSVCGKRISKPMYYIQKYYNGDIEDYKKRGMCRNCYYQSRRWLVRKNPV